MRAFDDALTDLNRIYASVPPSAEQMKTSGQHTCAARDLNPEPAD